MEENDDIVTLLNANGEEIEFIEIAGIAHQGCFYVILQPVELIEGMADDEALVFKVSRSENGEEKFEIELDDEIILHMNKIKKDMVKMIMDKLNSSACTMSMNYGESQVVKHVHMHILPDLLVKHGPEKSIDEVYEILKPEN